MIRELYRQVDLLTRILIESGMAIHQNYPSVNENELTWSGAHELSYVLKDSPYDELYLQCLKRHDYNYLMMDYALIQISYLCDRRNIIKHRLAYMPNPYVYQSADMPNDYDEIFFGDRRDPEVEQDNAVVFPVRFDFDISSDTFLEIDHPYSHITLGNYSDCRIPVSAPLTPFRFMHFILRCFYNRLFKENVLSIDDLSCRIGVSRTITRDEERILHLNFR